MMNNFVKYYLMAMMFVVLLVKPFSVLSQELSTAEAETASHEHHESEKLDPKSFIFGHIGDSYDFHITKIGDKHISVPLPIIVRSSERGWFVFSSNHLSHLAEGEDYNGFFIQPKGEKYEGKVVERNAAGVVVRPFDLSITKNVFAILLSVAIMLLVFLTAAHKYKKNPMGVPDKHQGIVEWLMFVIIDGVIRPAVGAKTERFAPFLLTLFFFIFINNLMGLIPIFPFGANVTGNLAVTMVLAVFTYLVTNVFGTREYWKEVLWPDVPLGLKVPVPLMPIIEIISTFTKPIALMIRLFANIFAGHMIILVLMLMIFIFAEMFGPSIGAGVSGISILFTIFMFFLELLVAFIQAYVFAMLSSVFIGMAQVEHHGHHEEELKGEQVNENQLNI